MTAGEGSPKPTGETVPGDLRYNLLVRLGNLGCARDCDAMTTEEIRAHWEAHLALERASL